MATERNMRGNIVCRECGRAFSFLAPHLRMTHEMSVSEYRERWGIAKYIPLASAEHSARCRTTLSDVSKVASWTLTCRSE